MRQLTLLLLFISSLAFGQTIKFSELPAASTLGGTEIVPAVQGGTNKKITVAQVYAYVQSLLTKSDVGLGNVDNTSDANKPISIIAADSIADLRESIDNLEESAIYFSPSFTGSGTVLDPIDVVVPDAGDPYALAMSALGGTIKAHTFGYSHMQANGTSALTDGQGRYVAVYLTRAATITGVKWTQTTQGSYTADNENRIGLYSVSGGTMTLRAASANNGNLWKEATNAFVATPFATPYDAPAGMYFVCLLYNNSAQVTAPQVAALTAGQFAPQATLDFTNGARLYPIINATSTLQATQSLGVGTSSLFPPSVFLY